MKGQLGIRLIGELTFILGLQIKQSASGNFISLSKYTKDLLKKFGMERENSFGMTMSPQTFIESDIQGKSTDKNLVEG